MQLLWKGWAAAPLNTWQLVGMESCKVSEKREKKKQTNLMPAQHQSQHFPIALTQATIVHATKMLILRPPTKKVKGEEAGAEATTCLKSRSILSLACQVGWH